MGQSPMYARAGFQHTAFKEKVARKKKKVSAKKPDPLIRRDPDDLGPFMCDCHYQVSMELALAGILNTGHLYAAAEELFQAFEAYMASVVLERPYIPKDEFRTECLKWIFANSHPLYEVTLAEVGNGLRHQPTPNEIRDWNCWLYRHFKYLKTEQSLNQPRKTHHA